MMSNKLIFTFAVIALQIITGLATPLKEAGNVLNRADNVADDLVHTPAGPFLRSNTHQIPAGSRIQSTDTAVNIIGPDGTTLHAATISKNAKLAPGNIANSLARRALTTGYVASAYWGNVDPSPLKSFTTSWAVPAVPENVDGQVIFLFNGLEPNSFDSILQPVLQFGGGSAAGGGNYWAVASWFVTGSSAFFTPLTVVNPGQVITGVMTLQSTQTSGGVTTYNYNSIFTGLPSSSLNTSTTEQLTIAFESLEIYGASGPSDLPHGLTAMKNINLIEQNGQRPALSWTLFSVGDEGFGVSVPKDGATNGEVDLVYPLQ